MCNDKVCGDMMRLFPTPCGLLLQPHYGHSWSAIQRDACMQRIFETSHVHVFSHATMPIFNLFRNCSYYWVFAAFVSYNINHPFYTEPPHTLMIVAFVIAYLCQVSALQSSRTCRPTIETVHSLLLSTAHLCWCCTC